jgi:hypothetical protein
MKGWISGLWKKSPQEKLEAAIRAMERRMFMWHWMAVPARRTVISHPDLCISMEREPKLKYRRYVKKGSSRGIGMLQFGWLLFSVRF